jgi:hypothetical protein
MSQEKRRRDERERVRRMQGSGFSSASPHQEAGDPEPVPPTITSIDPEEGAPGDEGLVVTVTGSAFVSGPVRLDHRYHALVLRRRSDELDRELRPRRVDRHADRWIRAGGLLQSRTRAHGRSRLGRDGLQVPLERHRRRRDRSDEQRHDVPVLLRVRRDEPRDGAQRHAELPVARTAAFNADYVKLASTSGESEYNDCSIYELVIINRVLSAGEESDLETYLMTKHGL